ncbi:MAG: tripartite tricarboxylate transporter substrate binding protein [Acetobacteraceae bacterium]|nr:tripartite tricarboxylate transporter substrate binding protein [Acetobacteraceae bacterium]
MRRAWILLAALLLAPFGAMAQDWPNRPVRILVIASAGGPTDIVARVLADGLSQRLPQRFVVENRVGAGGNIAASATAQATDQHTLLLTNTSHAVNRVLYRQLDYDPVRDLVPVTIVAESPMVLLVPPSSPHRSVADLVQAARREPGRLTYATAGAGGALQLVSLLFINAAGIQMQEVPYRGSAPAALDLAAGRLDMLYDAGLTGFQLARGGQARALAVSAAARNATMLDVPTIGEAGFPAATFSVWQVLMAPASVPAPILERLNRKAAAVLGDAAVRARLVELGADRILGNSLEEARHYVADEITRWESVLRAAGVQPQ